MDPIARLQASISQARPILAAVTPEQFSSQSTCSDWDVQALANHLLGALAMFRDIATAGPSALNPSETAPPDLVGNDLLGAYDDLSGQAVAAWRADDRADGAANMPWGPMPASMAIQMLADDVLVHSWDLARSTGQQVTWDDALAEETLTFAEGFFASPETRKGSFADPIPVGPDTDPMSRLVSFLGRAS
jgi:uncharacterized protein (TIGR03086 family)